MDVILPALVGGFTSLAVALLSAYLGSRHQRRNAVDAEQRALRETYLNPLRFYLVENHFRLGDTVRKVYEGGGRFAKVDIITEPSEVTTKPASWFTREGARLVGAVYLSACLFAHVARVRDNVPYLRLSRAADTRLAELLLQVQVGFLKEGGVPYVVQASIGQDVWQRAEQRLLSYREFCGLLSNADSRAWIDVVTQFHLDTARGNELHRVRLLLDAIEQLANFLDECVGGGASVASRATTEWAMREQYARLQAELGDAPDGHPDRPSRTLRRISGLRSR